MSTQERPKSTEPSDPRLKPVFHYDKGQGVFEQIEGNLGLVSIPKLPEPPSGKSIVLKVHGSKYVYYESFGTISSLSQRTLEGRFKQATGLNPNKAILLTDLPSFNVDPLKHQIITPEEIMRSYKLELRERTKTERGIR